MQFASRIATGVRSTATRTCRTGTFISNTDGARGFVSLVPRETKKSTDSSSTGFGSLVARDTKKDGTRGFVSLVPRDTKKTTDTRSAFGSLVARDTKKDGTRGFVSLVPRDTQQSSHSRSFVALVPQQGSSGLDAVPPTMHDYNGTKYGNLSAEPETAAPEKKAESSDEKWKNITVDMWRDAVYTNQTYFGELIEDTKEFVKTIAENIKLGGRRVSLVEVGCGTGEFVRGAADDFRSVVGVDFNKEFIDFCDLNTPAKDAKKSHYLQGDACKLNDLMKTEFPQTPQKGCRGVEFWDDTRVVACVGNTIGIIPEELRAGVYEQMAEVAGKDGIVVMVYWNARWFGDACLNFYHANPKLCGPFEGESVDFQNTTLTTPMNYKTKWTSVEEARAVMEDLGMEIISIREKGKGVFVAARRF